VTVSDGGRSLSRVIADRVEGDLKETLSLLSGGLLRSRSCRHVAGWLAASWSLAKGVAAMTNLPGSFEAG
jgi:hypothetical protein